MTTAHTKHSQKELLAHVSRIEGQLAAVRFALQADDCNKAAKTLLAASRSLASLRANCVNEFLIRKVYKGAEVKDTQLLEDVRSLMKA